MSDVKHSCNYTRSDAFEAFEHITFLLLQCRGWRLSPRVLPPPQSPFRHLLECVLRDLQALGFARPEPSGGWRLLKKKKWNLLLRCARECVKCPHTRKCPLATLFRSKGWRLPNEQLIDSVYCEGEEGVNRTYTFIKNISAWQKAFNDLLLVLIHKRNHALTLSPRSLYNLTGDANRSSRLGKLLIYLKSIGLAERVNRSKRRKRYRLVPEHAWRRFISICGSKPPQERYKCDGCPLAPQCPYFRVVTAAQG